MSNCTMIPRVFVRKSKLDADTHMYDVKGYAEKSDGNWVPTDAWMMVIARPSMQHGSLGIHLMIDSSHGQFSAQWSGMGEGFDEFEWAIQLAGMDEKSFIRDVTQSNHLELDPDETIKRAEGRILRARRQRLIGTVQGRVMFDQLQTLRGKSAEFILGAISSMGFFSDPDDGEAIKVSRIKPQVQQFYNDLWTPFADELYTSTQNAKRKSEGILAFG